MHEADWVVVGPGSWFTSVLPNLLVPELVAALQRDGGAAAADRQPRAPAGRDRRAVSRPAPRRAGRARARACGSTPCWSTRPRCEPDAPARASTPPPRRFGADVVVADVGARDGGPRHDVLRLAAAYLDIMGLRHVTRAWQDRRHGDDGPGEGGAREHLGDQVVLPQGRGLVDAALRRRAAHRRRPDRGRGRARHRCSRPPAAPRHRRGLRTSQRDRGDQRWRSAPRHPLRRPGDPRRRGAGPPDRAARPARPARTRAAAAGGLRLDAATRSPPGAARSSPTGRSPSPAGRARSR